MPRRRQAGSPRPRGRPRRPPIKTWRYRFEPGALVLRFWTTSLALASVHREVCRVLSARAALLRLALTRSLIPRRMADRASLHFLERATISTPYFVHGGRSFPLLLGAILSESTAAVPDFIARRIHRSRRRFVDWVARIEAPSVAGCGLAEYEAVLTALRQLRQPGKPFWRTLSRTLGANGVLMIGQRVYRFPAGWRDRVSATCPPAEVAAQLVSSWRLDRQTVKERISDWRKERRIAKTWRAYGVWLKHNSHARTELKAILRAVTPVGGK
jgi:hypothetical protein